MRTPTNLLIVTILMIFVCHVLIPLPHRHSWKGRLHSRRHDSQQLPSSIYYLIFDFLYLLIIIIIYYVYFSISLWRPLRVWIIPNWDFPNWKLWPLALQFCKAVQNQNFDWWMGIINPVWINIKTHTVQSGPRPGMRTFMEIPESLPQRNLEILTVKVVRLRARW